MKWNWNERDFNSVKLNLWAVPSYQVVHGMLQVVSAQCVAHDVHMIVSWPLECTCWRQFVMLWEDCVQSGIVPFIVIVIILTVIKWQPGGDFMKKGDACFHFFEGYGAILSWNWSWNLSFEHRPMYMVVWMEVRNKIHVCDVYISLHQESCVHGDVYTSLHKESCVHYLHEQRSICAMFV